MTAKIDLKQVLKHLYAPSAKQVSLVDVPPMNYLMIDGQGDPNTSQAFQDAVQTLYPMAYGLSNALKAQELAYTVMPLEGLWWMDDYSLDFYANKDRAFWTLMILQPEQVTAELVERVREEVRKKKQPPALDKLRFERYHEGLSVQIMHHGAFDDEPPTVARLTAYMEEHGYEVAGNHHEIYLSDFRRVEPAKLKTVIRYPVRRVGA